MGELEYIEAFDRGHGEVIECAKPGYMKRFVYMPKHPHQSLDVISFLVETCGCKITFVPTFGRYVKNRTDFKDIHYCFPRDQAAMIFQLTAYFLGDQP